LLPKPRPGSTEYFPTDGTPVALSPIMKLCKSILITEDNDDIRDTIADALREEGYEVHLAKNGREALETLKGLTQPALVLLDLMMPVMNGWEFLDAHRDESGGMKGGHQIVTISAVAATASIEDPTPLNTAASLRKPLSFSDLMTTVTRFCGPGDAPMIRSAAKLPTAS
jgi:CheY-like chemotaxis protein